MYSLKMGPIENGFLVKRDGNLQSLKAVNEKERKFWENTEKYWEQYC